MSQQSSLVGAWRILLTDPGFGYRYLVFSALLLLCWVVFANDLASALLVAAYNGIPPLGALLEGRGQVSLETYLNEWAARIPGLTFAVATAAVLAFPALAVARRLLIDSRHGSDERGRDRGTTAALSRLSAPTMIGLGAWFGLVMGIGESYYIATKTQLLGELVPGFRWASPDSLWMGPIIDVVLLALVAAGLRVLGSAWPALRSARVLVFALSFLTFLAWVLLAARLATWAALILAAALATRSAAFAARRPRALAPIARRSWPALTGVTLGVALAVLLHARASEGAAVAGLPGAPAKTPNVLIVVLDAQRAANTSLYGSARTTTPNLARRARTGVVFDRAISTSSWTLPSLASLFTGHLNRDLGTGLFTPLGTEYPTLAEVLSEHGYMTGGFVGNIYFGGAFYGLNRGFIRWEDQPRSLGMAFSSAVLARRFLTRPTRWLADGRRPVEKRADDINAAFLSWLDEVDERPFFAFLNYFDAHTPYAAPESFTSAFTPRKPLAALKFGHEPASYTTEQLGELELAYDASIAYLDYELDRLLEQLDRRGVLDRTLLVVTADHGEAFGEHGFLQHGNSLYIEEIQVPLVVFFPGVDRGRRVEGAVSLRSVPGTILDYLAFERRGIAGPSLVAYARHGPEENGGGPDPDHPSMAVSELDGWRSLVTRGYHYIRRPNGAQELYDLSSDPTESKDLSADPKAADLMAQLSRELGRALDGPRINRADERSPR